MAWDVSRRAVMGSGALGLAATGIGFGASTASGRAIKTVIVEESAIPESRQFASAFVGAAPSTRVIRIDRSLNGLLHEIDHTDCRFAGLTSDPAAMIAAQLLIERGGRPLLNWSHRYGAGRWTHHTAGVPALLTRASGGWPTALAHHVRDRLNGSTDGRVAACRSNACGLPETSPGMLVSWVIEMGEPLS